MTGQPKAIRVDRTSLLVGVGMTALLVLGVATIFGDAIAAAFSPPPAPSPAAAPQGTALTAASSGAATVPAADGGGGKS